MANTARQSIITITGDATSDQDVKLRLKNLESKDFQDKEGNLIKQPLAYGELAVNCRDENAAVYFKTYANGRFFYRRLSEPKTVDLTDESIATNEIDAPSMAAVYAVIKNLQDQIDDLKSKIK